MNLPFIAGKYALLRKIASGGMAEVFLAKHVGMDGFEKLVVLKRILPHLAHQPEYVRMFLDEAKTAADLRHSNLISTFEIGEDHGIYFMVMEFLHGQDVRTIFRSAVASKMEVPLQYSIGIMIDACAGLHYAHTKQDLKGKSLGIVHRDISPQNMIVTYEGETKIVDFGIAKTALQDAETASGVLKGKYSYMSPEQALGQVADHRTDIFALGIVLYEMTTLNRLFKKESEGQTLRAIIDCQIPSPSTLMPHYPDKLEIILMRALAKDRSQRFNSCEDFRIELEEFLAERRLVHSPPRLGQFMRELFKERIEKEKLLGAADDIEGLSALFWTGSHSHSRSNSGDVVPPPKADRRPDHTDTISTRIELSRKPIRLAWLAAAFIGLCLSVAMPAWVFWPRKPETPKALIAASEIATKPAIELEMEREKEVEVKPPEILPQKPHKKASGRLKVVVEPWAEVYLDGKAIGATPLAARALPEGRYEIRLENPKLGLKVTKSVTIASGKDTLVRHAW